MTKVVFDCQFCKEGKESGELAVIDHDGEECLIQSKTGGFICKDCWKKFMSFLHEDSEIVLCGTDEYDDSLPEEPEKEKKQLHAGLEDGTLNLIVFDDTEQLRTMLNTIGFLVGDEGIVTDEGKLVTCSGCGCKLTVDEIGHVMPPNHFYCNSSVCIMDYYERYGYPEEKEEVE